MTKMKEQKKKMGMLTRLKMTRFNNKPHVKKTQGLKILNYIFVEPRVVGKTLYGRKDIRGC
jgi:NifB/MoaA-like Fe-S oxidoreductase